MHDDEQHLVVRRAAGELALALLRRQQPVEPQVLGIGEGLVAVGHGMPFAVPESLARQG